MASLHRHPRRCSMMGKKEFPLLIAIVFNTQFNHRSRATSKCKLLLRGTGWIRNGLKRSVNRKPNPRCLKLIRGPSIRPLNFIFSKNMIGRHHIFIRLRKSLRLVFHLLIERKTMHHTRSRSIADIDGTISRSSFLRCHPTGCA